MAGDLLPRGIEERTEDFEESHNARVAFEQMFFEEAARSSAVKRLCTQVSRMLHSWLRASAIHRASAGRKTFEDEWRATLEDFGVDIDSSRPYAGRTRKDARKIEEAISSGHIRELFFHLDTFLRHRFVRDVVCAPASVLEGILEQMGFSPNTAQGAWIRKLREHLRDDDVSPEENLSKPEGPLFKEVTTKKGTPFSNLRNDHRAIDYKRPGVPAEHLDETYLDALCRHHGINCHPSDRTGQLAARGIHTERMSGETHPYAWSRVGKDKLYIALSDRELEFTNPINNTWVPYIRGDYANLLHNEHPWVADARAKNLPLRSGPSGTAHRFLVALVELGQDAKQARLAIAGFLGPIHAHSCHEILYATIGVGGCTYNPSSYQANVTSANDLATKLFDHDGD